MPALSRQNLSAKLSNRLVDDGVRGAGEVQTSDFISHRKFQTEILMRQAQRFREPFRLTAEYQNVPFLERRVPDQFVRKLRQEPELRRFDRTLSKSGQQMIPVVNDLAVDMFPVIHSGPFEVTAVHDKPERTDQPEFGSNRHTTTANVSGVLRDVRFV